MSRRRRPKRRLRRDRRLYLPGRRLETIASSTPTIVCQKAITGSYSACARRLLAASRSRRARLKPCIRQGSMAPAPDNASSSRTRWHTIWHWSVAGAVVAVLGLALVFVHEISWRARLDAPRPTLILSDRHGTFLTQIGNAAHSTDKDAPRLDYGYWPLERLPDRVVRATLALEDRRFWSHPGVDLIAIARALWHNLHGGRRSGASTIAIQVARMQQPTRRTLW